MPKPKEKGKLLVYSLIEPLRDPGRVFTPRPKAIFEFPDNELMRQPSQGTHFLCDAPSRTMSVGHFYPDAAGVMLSLVIYFFEHLLSVEENGAASLELHIPARQLLQQVLTGSAADSRGTTPMIPWTMWGEAVLVDVHRHAPIDMTLETLPLAFVARSVLLQAIAKPHSHPHLRSTNPSTATSTTTTAATFPLGEEPARLNTLVLADRHPRRVARALARGDGRLASGRSLLSTPSAFRTGTEEVEIHGRSVCRARINGDENGNERLYICSEAVLPEALQHVDPKCLDAFMCGDAVLIFEVSTA